MVMMLRGRGITPLHAAAGNGHVGIAKLLIENGADLNANPMGTHRCTQHQYSTRKTLLSFSF